MKDKKMLSSRTSPQAGVAIPQSFRNIQGIATSPSAPRNDKGTDCRVASFRAMTSLILALLLVIGCAAPAFAAAGNVFYSGDAGEFIFAPGSEYSLTDLFPNFKNVMPGDTLAQPITLKNNASNEVKVEIYIRSLGAHEDSEGFLSQLKLRIEKSQDNTMAYMFDAYANETAQLTDWVCLGMLYSGGEVNLNVILDVPVELDNRYQEQIGYLDWEFKIIEYPVEDTDPEPPKTGDEIDLTIPIVIMAVCAVSIFVLIPVVKKKRGGDDCV